MPIFHYKGTEQPCSLDMTGGPYVDLLFLFHSFYIVLQDIRIDACVPLYLIKR